jgi:oligopeptide/dipeptide ABC transporter ATP-binding protein
MSETLLRVEDLRVRFQSRLRRTTAVDGISLEVSTGEVVSLVGETGCGKTVTALSILRLLPSSATVTGHITFRGRDLLALKESEMQAVRGAEISMVFQNPATALNPVFSIGSQLRQVIRAHLDLDREGVEARIEEVLHSVGLPEVNRVLRGYPHQLSGGMLQRVMLGMSLACRPALLIADEPTTALDVTIAAQILRLIRRLQEEQGFSVLFVTHDLGIVRRVSDRVVVLYAGRVAEVAGTPDLLGDPLHPYAQGLLAAVPRGAARGSQLAAIPGTVPADVSVITGCAFADRCTYVFDRCRVERPVLLGDAHGHRAACHLLDHTPSAGAQGEVST